MLQALPPYLTLLLTLAASLISFPIQAQVQATEIGVVVMHGKGGNPGKYVDKLAQALEQEGFRVANLEMPWSGSRQYDVDMNSAANEVTAALEAMRAQGARKVFVSGHSQGGLFALYYGGQHEVDGLIPIAPGGQVDAQVFLNALGPSVAEARSLVASGSGEEKASFRDFEGSRGTNPVTTTAAIYLNWFDPNGAHTTRVFNKVKPGTPVLYVAPKRDYPGLIASKQANFSALPANPQTRLYEPDTDHLNAPTAAAQEIINWIKQIAGQ